MEKKIRKLRGKLKNFNKLNDSLIFTGLTVTLLTGQRLPGQLVCNKDNRSPRVLETGFKLLAVRTPGRGTS